MLYVESCKDYIEISGSNCLFYTLNNQLQLWGAANLFVRTHQSFIVSLNKITAYTNLDLEIETIESPIWRQYTGVVKKCPLVAT
ncbi:LytTR family transcriptional regulator DNA-binding domain-containing protein [Mucilaginibacter sp. OK098]|uniref:LytTR family transcriptional regulator DNA-binding domain-containing protein n=1 Tax=Mucilaginibacter sp. OK098 TaxID=1855297 RepID=UPI0009333C93